MYKVVIILVETLSDSEHSLFVSFEDISEGPPLWSSGQTSWLQIQRSQVRFRQLPHYKELFFCGVVCARFGVDCVGPKNAVFWVVFMAETMRNVFWGVAPFGCS
jgi:hypothetical protein